MFKNKYFILIIILLCLLPSALILFTYDKLPDKIPIHFDISGNADNYIGKNAYLIGVPVFNVLLTLLVTFMINADPKKHNNPLVIKLIGVFIVPIINILTTIFIIFVSLNYKMPSYLNLSVFLGLSFIVIGNYLPKTKQNYTIGIKIPWTLNSTDNWNKTHRLAGFLWVIGGVLLIIFPKQISIFIAILIIIVPCVYSYALYTFKKI